MKEISNEKAAAALKQEELGVPMEDIVRDMGVSRETYLRWRRGYRGSAACIPADCNAQTSRAPEDE